jgi:hypothetical protein
LIVELNGKDRFKNRKMNKDIKEERDNVPFDIEELTNWYYGGAEKVKRRRFFGN